MLNDVNTHENQVFVNTLTLHRTRNGHALDVHEVSHDHEDTPNTRIYRENAVGHKYRHDKQARNNEVVTHVKHALKPQVIQMQVYRDLISTNTHHVTQAAPHRQLLAHLQD